MLKFCPLLLFIYFVLASVAHAVPAVVITLASVADRVRTQNPDLAAARLGIQEALGRMNQSGRLTNPELETSLEHNSRFREGKFEIGLTQKFPLTDRLRLEKKISLTELKASEAEVREMERQLAGRAREIVVKILASNGRRALFSKQAAVTREFSEFLTETAAKGEGSAMDAGQARLEATSITLELKQLNAAASTLLGELKPLIGMPLGSVLEIAGSLTPAIFPAGDSDHGRRPDLQVARLESAAANHALNLEQARRIEDVEAGLFAAAERTEDAPEGLGNEAIVGVRFKMPLPFWNKNEGTIQEAEARKTRRDLEVTALAGRIRLEGESARSEMAEWAQVIREIEMTLLPLADEQSALAETTFRNGQGEIQSVLRSREKKLQLAVAQLDALREFHLARVRYETSIAKP